MQTDINLYLNLLHDYEGQNDDIPRKLVKIIINAANRWEKFKFLTLEFFANCQKIKMDDFVYKKYQTTLCLLTNAIRSIDKSKPFADSKILWPEEFIRKKQEIKNHLNISWTEENVTLMRIMMMNDLTFKNRVEENLKKYYPQIAGKLMLK